MQGRDGEARTGLFHGFSSISWRPVSADILLIMQSFVCFT
jgi:hypothetical protein